MFHNHIAQLAILLLGVFNFCTMNGNCDTDPYFDLYRLFERMLPCTEHDLVRLPQISVYSHYFTSGTSASFIQR